MIGTDALGTPAPGFGNGGSGVLITINTNEVGRPNAGANPIAFNLGDGINTSCGNSFLRNSIHSNGGLEIDVAGGGVTPNDNETDCVQNFLVLVFAKTSGTPISIDGSLNSAPNTDFRVEYFVTEVCDGDADGIPSGGTHGEGEISLEFIITTTDASGDARVKAIYNQAVSAGVFVTSTATAQGGDTSEYSRCIQVATP